MTKVIGVASVLLPLLKCIFILCPTALCFVVVSKYHPDLTPPTTQYQFLSNTNNIAADNVRRRTSLFILHAKKKKKQTDESTVPKNSNNQNNSKNDNDYASVDETEPVSVEPDIITLDNAGDPLRDDELEWLSDRDLLRRAVNSPGGEALTNRDPVTLQPLKVANVSPPPYNHHFDDDTKNIDGDDVGPTELSVVERGENNDTNEEESKTKKPTSDKEDDKPKEYVYSDEEEELIQSMGGKGGEISQEKSGAASTREPGYLGDCTLSEIARDFSVPVCYMADVLVKWGCPVPIDTQTVPLGDMVTGEQAFALLEAIHTLDVSDLYDRYSDDDILTLCAEYEDFMDLKQAFDFCVKENWSLPFGVRTNLRVEQEEELLRALVGEENL